MCIYIITRFIWNWEHNRTSITNWIMKRRVYVYVRSRFLSNQATKLYFLSHINRLEFQCLVEWLNTKKILLLSPVLWCGISENLPSRLQRQTFFLERFPNQLGCRIRTRKSLNLVNEMTELYPLWHPPCLANSLDNIRVREARFKCLDHSFLLSKSWNPMFLNLNW